MNYAATATRIVGRGRDQGLHPGEVGVGHDGKVYVYETPSDREDFRRWAEEAWIDAGRWGGAESFWHGDLLCIEALSEEVTR